MTSTLSDYFDDRCNLINDLLDKKLPLENEFPKLIHESMRYSVFTGGKRLRPIICLASAESCGGTLEKAYPSALAVELIHTYSLIHDDLPCMDDDKLRRGKPTNHVKYNEAIAVLTGDALLTFAFEILADAKPTDRYSLSDYFKELSHFSGSKYLIGGQVLDIQMEGDKEMLTKNNVISIHNNKTAALLTSSLRLGAMSANASDQQLESLTTYGQSLGLAFQIVDDILDVTQNSPKLGKSAKKDQDNNKVTFPAVFGLDESRNQAKLLTKKAKESLHNLGDSFFRLDQISDYLLNREY